MRPRRPDLWRIAAAFFLTVLFGFQFYRAATMSITVDEARVYLDFIRPDPPALLNSYEAAHHILQTYLSWFFVRRWGGSELVLRIPALIACLAYFGFVWKFALRLFQPGALFLISVLVLASNPLILDHLCIARGYGLALALFAWMLYATLLFTTSGSRNSLTAAGILGGLSVATNLTFLVPVCALAGVTVMAYRWKPPATRVDLLNDYLGPGVVLCALLILLPLSHVDPKQHFYFGSDTLATMANSLILPSFDRRYWGRAALLLGYGAALMALIFAGAGAAEAFLRSRITAVLMATATLVIALAAMLVAGGGFHVPYPNGRTGLWIVFLVTAAGVAGAAALMPYARWIAPALLLLCGAASLAYVAQYNPRFTYEWRFNSATKRFMDVIRQREKTRNTAITVSGNPEYRFPVNYYRARWKLANMREVPFGEPQRGADYYFFQGGDPREQAAPFNAHVIEEDRLCLCSLAAR